MYKFARNLPLMATCASKAKIMTKKITVILFAAMAAAMGAVGCSSYNKLLKTNDSEAMYSAAIEYYNKGNFERATQLFEEIAPRFSGSMRADTIMYYTGCCYYKQGDFGTSAAIFDNYRRTYGRSPLLEDVEYMYAMGFYFSSPEATRDQTTTQQAIICINEFMERYPDSPKKALCELRLGELKNKLYDKSFYNARTYYKTERYKSAIIALRNALAEYPESPHREEMLFLALDSAYRLASNSLASLQVDRYLDTMDAYYNFVSEYPDSKYRRDADRMQRSTKDFLAKHNAESQDTAAAATQTTNTNLK